MTEQVEKPRPHILLVDDDPAFLELLRRHLSHDYEITTVPGGREALAELSRDPAIAVIVSDMNMPQMDGATLLARVKREAPAIVRVMLTGNSDLAVAAQAINTGQIFRFLRKSCSREEIRGAIGDSVEQHRLLLAERELLQCTLMGTIEALMDALAVVNPVAFSRAQRIHRTVVDVAKLAALPPSWSLEAAALLSQLGCLAVPQPVLERMLRGDRLSTTERRQLDRVHKVACDLLKRIPRLEPVIEIIAALDAAVGPSHGEQATPTEILRLAVDFDRYLLQIGDAKRAIDALQAHIARYSPPLLKILAAKFSTDLQPTPIREVPLIRVTAGMVFAHEVRTETGALLVPADFEVTRSFLERMHNFSPAILEQTVLIRGYAQSEPAGR